MDDIGKKLEEIVLNQEKIHKKAKEEGEEKGRKDFEEEILTGRW